MLIYLCAFYVLISFCIYLCIHESMHVSNFQEIVFSFQHVHSWDWTQNQEECFYPWNHLAAPYKYLFFCLIFKIFGIILKLYLSLLFPLSKSSYTSSPISFQIHGLFSTIIKYIFIYLDACIFIIITCSIQILLLLCVLHIEGMTFWN